MSTILHGKTAIDNVKNALKILDEKSIITEKQEYATMFYDAKEQLINALNILGAINSSQWEEIMKYKDSLNNFKKKTDEIVEKFEWIKLHDFTKKLQTTSASLAGQYLSGLQEAINNLIRVSNQYFIDINKDD